MAKHIHKFLRVPAKKTHTWICVNCSWFVHEGLAHILYSKTCECWSCGDEFQMSVLAASEDKPRCDVCRGVSSESIDALLREKGLLGDDE